MDTNSFLCVIELLGILLVAAAAAVIRNWASIRESLDAMRDTTRATRPQWKSMLTGILGTNLGYIVLVGTYTLALWLENPADAKVFMIPATVITYLTCAIPAYFPIGAVSGILLYRFAKRKNISPQASFTITLVISTFLGAIFAIPIYLVGIMSAAF